MKKILILFSLFAFFLVSYGQIIPKPESEKKSTEGFDYQLKLPSSESSTADKRRSNKIRLVYGGGIGLNYNIDYFSVLVAPEIGVQLSDWLLIGVTPSYQFAFGQTVTAHIFGVSPYIQPNIKNFLIHAEYSYRTERMTWEGDLDPEIKNYNSFNAGIGYNYPVVNNISVYVLALVQVYQWNKDASLKQNLNPQIRFGVNLGR